MNVFLRSRAWKVHVQDRNGATGPPTETLRYSERDRKRDYRQGRTDARRHLPLVPRQPALGRGTELVELPGADGNPAVRATQAVEPTPFLTELFHRRNQVLADKFAAYLSERTRLLDELRDADGRHRHLLAEQDVAQARLEAASVPLTEQEATRRHFGEVEAGHPEELVRRRRTRDRQREVSAAQERLRDIVRQVHEAEVAAGRARDALDGLLKATQAQGMGINSHFEQRKASYLNGLAHQHRRGPELLRALMLTDPGLPDWLSWHTEAIEGA
jgi:hypothetical protein